MNSSKEKRNSRISKRQLVYAYNKSSSCRPLQYYRGIPHTRGCFVHPGTFQRQYDWLNSKKEPLSLSLPIPIVLHPLGKLIWDMTGKDAKIPKNPTPLEFRLRVQEYREYVAENERPIYDQVANFIFLQEGLLEVELFGIRPKLIKK